eukprot:TRINITY_DN4816_c0_g2_i1.p1 TRINITY_DN4816_c0_g2~~TRINITY_DN4816_c0_g2_i1.p1  ORF type:complete len:324 (-),score=62.20 TRINITY_DN4816_c0_g2_i1:32-1003(-)
MSGEKRTLFGLKVPLIVAPMAGVSGGLLASEASKSGALGLIAAGYSPAEKVLTEIEIARQAFELKPQEVLPVGIGYIVWWLDQNKSLFFQVLETTTKPNSNPLAAYWFSFGNPKTYIELIKQHSPKSLVIVQIQFPDEALEAVQNGADILVVQGNEAGGHGAVSNPTVKELTLSVLQKLASAKCSHIPVYSAGGLVDAADIASMLHIGAAGVCMGTRFVATPESLYHPNAKQAIVDAKGSKATVRTKIIDQLRGYHWPANFNGRVLSNRATAWEEEANEKKTSFDELKENFQEAVNKGDPCYMGIFAGTGVSRIKEIIPTSKK